MSISHLVITGSYPGHEEEESVFDLTITKTTREVIEEETAVAIKIDDDDDKEDDNNHLQVDGEDDNIEGTAMIIPTATTSKPIANSSKPIIPLHISRKSHNHENGIEQEKKHINPKFTSSKFDFAVVGCADEWKNRIEIILFDNTTKIQWFRNHKVLEPLMEEKKWMETFPRSKLHTWARQILRNEGGTRTLKGITLYEEPLTSSFSLARFESFFPTTKLIFMVKHPIYWISDYVTKIQLLREKVISPSFLQEMLMMKCRVGHNPGLNETDAPFRSVCIENANFHVHLSRLGYTALDSHEELLLLGDLDTDYSVHNFHKTKVFLFDNLQLYDGNEARNSQFLHDLESFLEIDGLSMHTSSDSIHNHKKSYKARYYERRDKFHFNICNPQYANLRAKLTQIGTDASTWIRDYFLESPNVVVPNKERFLESIDRWRTDPCSLSEEEKFEPEYTSSLYQWGVVGMQKCATTFIYKSFLKHPLIDMPYVEDHHLHDEGILQLQKSIDMVDPSMAITLEKEGGSMKPIISGFSTPDALTHALSLNRLETYYTDLKMIFSVKHPIKWFMSWYNFVALNHSKGSEMKRPNEYIGECGFDCKTNCVAGVEAYYLVCTGFARFHVHLSRLGWTPLDTERELALLGNPRQTIENYSVHNFANQKLFLIEEGQMRDNNSSRSSILERTMEQHVGVDDNSLKLDTDTRINTISDVASERARNTSKAKLIDICDDEHEQIRKVLLEIGRNATEWISDYFIHSPQVIVANKDDFLNRLEQWKHDPCENSKTDA